jgi:hypothetical protein
MREPGMSLPGTVYLRCLQAIGRRLGYGTSAYDREWDVLVVLDGCRADLLSSVAPDVDFLGDVETVRSVGSSSSEWLENTFGDQQATGETVLVTGNTWTDRYLTAADFAALDEVWKYAWDETLGTVPADAITERAIAHARERDPAWLVVHYMQPHHPFVPDPLDVDDGMRRSGSESSHTNPWIALRRGEVSLDRVWQAYEANLRYVLESVGTLCENVDGTVGITADHGNLFGEWGLYGHPMHTPVPALLAVPWAETTAADRGTHTPTLEPPEPLPVSRVHGEETDRDRLAALGYL